MYATFPISQQALEVGLLRASNMVSTCTTTNQLYVALRYIRLLMDHVSIRSPMFIKDPQAYHIQINDILTRLEERYALMENTT